ncbi:Fic family protein [Pseudomonas aeruginosa]|uniref:Fic family protein n=1 Tax=Pseudomonas aeruginosa TaxID=287 RepID=UPI001067C39D|nr:Fic family protein [Pseudomonas aeruginosa]TEN87205.1 Fic family protein [Pseudomonas aeruginosa]
MASIKTPPSPDVIHTAIQSNIDRYIDNLDKHSYVDSKGRYQHWHDFRFRVPAGEDAVLAWAAVKRSRSSILRETGLYAENGKPMRFCLPDSASTVVHKIDQLSAKIGAHSPSNSSSTENNQYLVESLMMEEAISSAQLEGASTTRRVAKEMLESERPPSNDDERMIVNNFLLMKLAKRSRNLKLSIELIRRFHEEATRGIQEEKALPGEIRQDNDIFVVDRNSEIAHQPPDHKLLLQRLEALYDFANTEHNGQDGELFIHPAVKAIILHFMLGYEHAFNDGNGRTARGIFYWYMLKTGYWGFEYISISTLLKKAPAQYGESYLFTETDDFDLTYFINYQLCIIERAMDDFLSHLNKKRREFFEIMTWLERSGFSKDLNFRQVHLIKKVVRNPGRLFTAKEVKNDFGVSEGTARTDLEKLVKLKLLAKHREGKSYIYVARGDAIETVKSSVT